MLNAVVLEALPVGPAREGAEAKPEKKAVGFAALFACCGYMEVAGVVIGHLLRPAIQARVGEGIVFDALKYLAGARCGVGVRLVEFADLLIREAVPLAVD